MSAETPNAGGQDSWLRPQSVIFTLLAEHLLDRDLPAVFAGSFIEVLDRIGVTEHATRATLTRMHKRGLLDKERLGRRTYFQMSERCVRILEGGRERMWLTGAVNRQREEAWTIVTFSLPETWQRQRYELRVRLTWAGFGPLQNGVWLAPATVDVEGILQELALSEYARVFHAQSVHPQDPARIIGDAFSLENLADRYRAFIEEWRAVQPADHADALVLTLRLSTQWLRLIRDDPRVPLHLLPDPWPAIEAERLFRCLHEQHRAEARTLADQILELAPSTR